MTAPGLFPIDPFFFQIAVIYALTIIWATTLRRVDRHRWLVDLQLALDALLVTSFIYATGGITSYFTSLYLLPIIAASVVRNRRGALVVASLTTVLYGGLVLAQYLAASGLRADPWLDRLFAVMLPSRIGRALHRRAERVRIVRGGRCSSGIARRQPAVGGRAAGAGARARSPISRP